MIVSFDDLYINDQNNLDRLFYLKGKYPTLKVNLFCVPNRSTYQWLHYLMLDWIGLHMHGWQHTKGEEITQDMLDEWKLMMDNKIYKSPWYDDKPEQLDLLHQNGFTLVTYPVQLDHPISQVVLKESDFRGHMWQDKDWDRLEAICKTETNFELI